jgi:hypothetical protein
MLKQIAALILFLLGLLSLAFSRYYKGTLVPHPWIFAVIGTLMLIITYALSRSSTSSQESVFICQLDNPRTGEKERFLSPVIPKDKITLSFYLENQKTTTLHVDKTDHTRYYLDLDFLFA